MTISKAQQKAVAKYNSINYDNIHFRVKKGQKESIRKHAENQGESLNEFINRAITETIQKDTNA